MTSSSRNAPTPTNSPVPSSSIATQRPDYDTLGGRLVRARVAAGLNPAHLAKQIGVKKQTLEAWETDRSEPRSNRLTTLSGLLGVSPTWLLYGVGSSPQTETLADEVQVLKGQFERLSELHEQTGIALANIEGAIARLSNVEDET
ncbi:MAG: helix-turn-helix domain-containing protein [Pseudomonadota bacterium]